MARKDAIFQSFINHELIKKQYDLRDADLPTSLHEGLNSDLPIIKTIALIVEDTESYSSSSDKSLYASLTQYLNVSAL